MPLGSYTSAAFTTATGVAVAANADVEVRRESDSGLASIFSDRAGTLAITQPGFQADGEGRFVFYAAGISGGYSVKVTKGAETFTARFQATGTARELDADPSWASALVTAISATIITFLAAATKALARTAIGFGAATDQKIQIGDGTDFISVPVPMGFSILNGYLDWTVAGNVLTVAVKNWAGSDPSAADPVYIGFRSATLATGLPLIRKLTAATSISINDTATLGTVNSTAFRLWCVAFDDAGTVRLALLNCLSGTAPNFSIFPLAGWGIASSTLEDAASDSAHVFYSAGAAVASKPYATLGYATWGSELATAGTWSAAPTRVQLFGSGVPLPGWTVQQVREQTGAVATGTTQLPVDDTIPQNTEGDEYIDVSVTPTSAANLLEIEASLQLANNAATGHIGTALFHDAVANALTAMARNFASASNRWVTGQLKHQMLAGTTSSKTFDCRAGANVAGTTTFNGGAGVRDFGGVNNSFLSVTEIMA